MVPFQFDAAFAPVSAHCTMANGATLLISLLSGHLCASHEYQDGYHGRALQLSFLWSTSDYCFVACDLGTFEHLGPQARTAPAFSENCQHFSRKLSRASITECGV